MNSINIIILAVFFAGTQSVSGQTAGCLVKEPNTKVKCLYFGNIYYNEPQNNEVLRTKIYVKSTSTPPVLTLKTLSAQQVIFAPYMAKYALYNNYVYYIYESSPKTTGGSLSALQDGLTEIEVVVGKDTTTTFYVKGPNGFILSWESNYKFDVSTSEICIGKDTGIDTNEFYYDCPPTTPSTTTLPSTTTIPPSTTTTVPSTTTTLSSTTTTLPLTTTTLPSTTTTSQSTTTILQSTTTIKSSSTTSDSRTTTTENNTTTNEPSNTTTENDTTTDEPYTTTEPIQKPGRTNILIKIAAQIRVELPPDTEAILNLKPEINKTT